MGGPVVTTLDELRTRTLFVVDGARVAVAVRSHDSEKVALSSILIDADLVDNPVAFFDAIDAVSIMSDVVMSEVSGVPANLTPVLVLGPGVWGNITAMPIGDDVLLFVGLSSDRTRMAARWVSVAGDPLNDDDVAGLALSFLEENSWLRQ